MMGKSHLITGVCALEHAYAASVFIDRTNNPVFVEAQCRIQAYLGLADLAALSKAALPLYIAAYLLGTILPDIDNPNSLLGRIVHVPVKHRRWFHAIYFYLPLLPLGVMYPVFGWLFLGVFVHLFWDSFSAMGNCWFYKLLSDYKEYPSGAQIKKGHYLKLYHAGAWSEYLLLFVIVAVTVASFIWISRG